MNSALSRSLGNLIHTYYGGILTISLMLMCCGIYIIINLPCIELIEILFLIFSGVGIGINLEWLNKKEY